MCRWLTWVLITRFIGGGLFNNHQYGHGGVPGIERGACGTWRLDGTAKEILWLYLSGGGLYPYLHDTVPSTEWRWFGNRKKDSCLVISSSDGCRDMISALVDLYLSNNDQRMNAIMYFYSIDFFGRYLGNEFPVDAWTGMEIWLYLCMGTDVGIGHYHLLFL